MAMKLLVAALLLAAASAAHAGPLTVRTGESWLFTVQKGEPAYPRKVDASAKPARGQIMVTVRALFGTNMIMTNNSAVAYTFRAELLSADKPTAARPCNLPANGRPILEQWPQKADAVRIGNFQSVGSGGRC
jgi:hypothetical protein